MIPVRVCLLYAPRVFDLRPGKQTSAQVSSPLYNSILQRAASKQFNITYVFPEVNRMGALIDRDTMQYDGCLGSLQRNESDVATIAPVDGWYGPSVQPWLPVWSDYTLIGSVYWDVDPSQNQWTRVMDFLDAFKLDCWLLTCSSLFVLCSMILVSMLLHKKRSCKVADPPTVPQGQTSERVLQPCHRKMISRTFMMLISCVLKQHTNSGPLKTRSIAVLYTVMALLCFYAGYFLTSMIKTEMVVLDRPVTYDSYQDLLDNDTIPLWVDGLDDQRTFRDAAKGTPERQLWDRAVERGINKSLVSADIMSDVPALLKLAKALHDRKVVGLTSSALTQIMISNLCWINHGSRMFPHGKAYIAREDRAVESIRSVCGSTFAHPMIRKILQRYGRYWTETDPGVAMMIRNYDKVLAPEGGERYYSKVITCKSGIIEMPDPDLRPVILYHYRDLIMICMIMYVVSMIVMLLRELVGKMVRGRVSRISLPIIIITPPL